jgi:hypothetical protein
MSQATGSNGQILLSTAEATFGVTPVTPSSQVFPFSGEGIQAKTALNKSNIIRKNRSAVMPTHGNHDVTGNIATEMNIAMARIYRMIFGSVTTTGSAAPYTHVFKIGSALPTHTIEKGFTDLGKYFLYNGCKVNKASWDIPPSGVLPLSIDFMGASRVESGATFDGTAVDLGFTPFQGFDATIKEAGTVIATVTALKFSLENTLDGNVYVIGSQGKRYSLPEGVTVVSGQVTALFDSDALLLKAINGTESSLDVKLAHGDGTGSAGNESIEIQIDELIYQEQDPIIKDMKGILVDLPFTAYWDNGSNGTSIMATIKNTQPSAL